MICGAILWLRPGNIVSIQCNLSSPDADDIAKEKTKYVRFLIIGIPIIYVAITMFYLARVKKRKLPYFRFCTSGSRFR
ncbi:hypothetical protein NG42_18920 [Winslowiella iniecta]|uniref:Uncharacterized protein n=1 Tax=Winslowiella iniecta TaxID=1560201 RepID=A0A0L7T4B6_9GAMM|nr:hypothetical protein NG42_18920 [Winslowiella iniecta]KOC90051.1 hypothetical protein NG43_17835 [Winslowiella iniecta]